MAPEVFKHRKYDKKVDIFSFAMILYEVIFYPKSRGRPKGHSDHLDLSYRAVKALALVGPRSVFGLG
jgi:serine/threonine protein kinase